MIFLFQKIFLLIKCRVLVSGMRNKRINIALIRRQLLPLDTSPIWKSSNSVKAGVLPFSEETPRSIFGSWPKKRNILLKFFETQFGLDHTVASRAEPGRAGPAQWSTSNDPTTEPWPTTSIATENSRSEELDLTTFLS